MNKICECNFYLKNNAFPNAEEISWDLGSLRLTSANVLSQGNLSRLLFGVGSVV